MQSYLQRRRIQGEAERRHTLDRLCGKREQHTKGTPIQDTHNDQQDGIGDDQSTKGRRFGSIGDQHDLDVHQSKEKHHGQRDTPRDASPAQAADNTSQHAHQDFLIDWEDDEDSENPRNWSYIKRFGITLLIVCIRFVVGFASSIDSSARSVAAEEFGVARVVESISTANFLFGLAAGALFAGPFSEAFGRNAVYITTLLMSLIWLMASALAPNIGAQLAFRFLAGLFAATPLVCAGGSISDLWNPKERTISFVLFATVSYTGPVAGPLVGGWIVNSHQVSWRWTEWVTLIIAGVITCLTVFLLPETYAPMLLYWKADRIRHLTGDARYQTRSEQDAGHHKSISKILQTTIARPFLLVVQERIILLFTIYLTIIYIVLYTFFGGYENIFGNTYGLSRGLIGTCFLGIFVGLCLVWLLVPVIWKLQNRNQDDGSDEDFPPEARLWFSMLGGALAIPVSLFWMGWTAYPSISIASPLVASVLFGYGILCVWITAYQYIIDSYESYSASALAAMTAIRYTCAGGMTIVGVPFYDNLGVQYTLTILACLSALMVPIPYMFYIWGKDIRSKSKFATK